MLHWGEGHLLPAVRTRQHGTESVLVLDILEWTVVLFFDRIITLLPALPPQAHVCPALRLRTLQRKGRRRWVYRLNIEDEVATDLVGELETENFEVVNNGRLLR